MPYVECTRTHRQTGRQALALLLDTIPAAQSLLALPCMCQPSISMCQASTAEAQFLSTVQHSSEHSFCMQVGVWSTSCREASVNPCPHHHVLLGCHDWNNFRVMQSCVCTGSATNATSATAWIFTSLLPCDVQYCTLYGDICCIFIRVASSIML